MKVAIENLFEDGCGNAVDGKSRFTSRVEEVIAVIERFNDPEVCCCWDFGHAACSFGHKDMLEYLKPAGKYVECTHVHDNFYGKDLHLVPFLGGVPWESHMQYLKEIGYSGNLSFELGYSGIPEHMMPDWLKHTYTVGQYLQKLAE